MKGLSAMKRTASTSSIILAVSSAITSLSGKAVMISHPISVSTNHLPLNRLAATIDQRALVRSGHLHLFGRGPGCFLQRDFLLIWRHVVMLRTIERGESFKLVERPL